VTTVAETALAFMHALWACDTNACEALLTEDATWAFHLSMPQASMPDTRIWPARSDAPDCVRLVRPVV
jgi:hypothetical protein